MTQMQLYAELLRNMSIIAEDENMLKRAAKYLRKLVAEKQAGSAEFTREEFSWINTFRVYEPLHRIHQGAGTTRPQGS